MTGFALSNATVAELAAAARAVNRLLAPGRLQPRGVRAMPLSAAAEAHTLLERGETGHDRLVLVPPGA